MDKETISLRNAAERSHDLKPRRSCDYLQSVVSRGWRRGSQIQGAEEEVDCEQMKTASAADSTRSLTSAKDVFQGFSVSPNSQTAPNFPHDFLLQPQESHRCTAVSGGR